MSDPGLGLLIFSFCLSLSPISRSLESSLGLLLFSLLLLLLLLFLLLLLLLRLSPILPALCPATVLNVLNMSMSDTLVGAIQILTTPFLSHFSRWLFLSM